MATFRTMADGILLLGPTACGKSALALRLAHERALEIVSVDSAQVYRGMDIGTAKPSAEERAFVPHHLIDIRDPAEPYCAADFAGAAPGIVAAIRRRGRLPLIVGGTMLYATALREGLSELPSADAAVRARLDADAALLGWPALHARLARVDPAAAARLKRNDSQRIQRALEVFEVTGVALSRLQSERRPPQLALALVALLPGDRAELHRRIEQRFDAMLRSGFVDEVRQLKSRGDLSPELPSMRSVGYRQAWTHLAGGTNAAGFRAAGIAATRQLAKRQITWLRSMRDGVCIDPFAPDAFEQLRAAVEAIEQAPRALTPR
jgi:tRNA dimethylallyltransferase